MKFFKDLFRFIKDDFIGDFKAISLAIERHEKGEPIFDPVKVANYKKQFQEWSWYDFFKTNWLFFLMLTLAFTSGYFVATQDHQDTCNEYIIENYIEPLERGELRYVPMAERNMFDPEKEVIIGLGLDEIPNIELE